MTREFVFENPPLVQSEDGRVLAEYLHRQMLALADSFEKIHDWEDAEPFRGKARDAMLRWFYNGAPGNDKGPGYYYFYNGSWIYIGGAELLSYGESIPGAGNVWDDLNAHDFTGHQYAGQDGCASTALSIKTNATVFFGHNGISYIWMGRQGVCVGVGGTHTAQANDLAPLGTGDHAVLSNRNIADQHSQSAITDLVSDQAQQDLNLQNHVNDGGNPHNVQHSQLPDVDPDPQDPHSQYQQKGVSMVMGGTTSSFTLNATDSKLVNYAFSAQWHWPDDNDVDPVNGEITIPEDGIYKFTAHILGDQGNDTKEEWIELRIDVQNGPDPGRGRIDILEVATDKTTGRCLQASWTRAAYAGEVYSLWMWASSGLGTFTVDGTTFEIQKTADIGELVPS